MRWYITIRAIGEYQQIMGYPAQADGPWFDRAETELADLCEAAALKKSCADQGGDTALYQVSTPVRGAKRHRIELYVRETRRAEGDLDQLVRVRDKDASPHSGQGAPNRRQREERSR